MGQVLSEGEVDALLKGVGEGEVQTETDQVDEVTGVTAYDLTSQEKIIAGRLPTLDIVNQMFSRLFRQTFSGMLRKAVEVNAVSTDTVKFSHSGYRQSNVFPVISSNVFGHVTKSSGSQRCIHGHGQVWRIPALVTYSRQSPYF